MNGKKNALTSSQWTVFLGVHMDSIQMQARLAPTRISSKWKVFESQCLAHVVDLVSYPMGPVLEFLQ